MLARSAPYCHSLCETQESRTQYGISRTAESYSYTRLQSKEHFRLLRLSPKSFVHPSEVTKAIEYRHMHIELTDHSMSDDNISYECLSYAWGDNLPGCSLWIGRLFSIEIGENLRYALRSLQHETQSRSIWVDALCINQADLEEKMQQVQLMYQIYTNAAKVIVSLGPEADGSQHMPNLFRRILRADPDKVAKPMQHRIPISHRDYLAVGLPSREDDVWIALMEFLSRPWFARVWVVQEALAAIKLEYLCGSWLQPGSIVNLALTLADLYALPMARLWRGNENMSKGPGARAIKQLELMVHQGLLSVSSALEPPSRLLVDLLEGTRYAAASDPRDKIYSLLNLCSDRKTLDISPDYTVGMQTVFLRTARRIIEEGQGPRLLLSTGFQRSSCGLSSWTPDWAAEYLPYFSIARPRFMQLDKHHSSSLLPSSEVRMGQIEDQVIVTALLIDQIECFGSTYRFSPSTDNSSQPYTPTKLQNEGDQYASASDSHCSEDDNSHAERGCLMPGLDKYEHGLKKLPVPYRSFIYTLAFIEKSAWYKDKDVVDTVWSTLFCQRTGSPSGRVDEGHLKAAQAYYEIGRILYEHDGTLWCSETANDIWRHIWEFKSRGLQDPDEASRSVMAYYQRIAADFQVELFESLLRLGYTYRLIRTSRGIVGMVPYTAKEGDHMVQVKDMVTPLIMRKVDNTKDTYSVIGPAYFYGFLPGQDEHTKLMARDDWQDLTLV